MHNVSHKDSACLLNMLDSCEKIHRYSSKYKSADDFYNDTIAFDASLMNFIIIGEMVEKLSDEFIHHYDKDINWLQVKGFRNIIAHNYFGVDAEEVWQIINGTLKSLQKFLVTTTNH